MTRQVARFTMLRCASALTACTADAIARAPSSNDGVPLDHLLTTPEGCKVYRFWDAGRYHYTTVCPLRQETTTTDPGKARRSATITTDYATAPEGT